jgi:hypothetical protein
LHALLRKDEMGKALGAWQGMVHHSIDGTVP